MQLIFVCLGLAAFMTLGSSLECYQCINCQSSFKDTGSNECPDVSRLNERCVKEITTGGEVNRGCGTTAGCTLLEAISKCDGKHVRQCAICCDTDECNGATALQISGVAVGLVAALPNSVIG